MKRQFWGKVILLMSIMTICACGGSNDDTSDIVLADIGTIRVNDVMRVSSANRDKVIDLYKQLIVASMGDPGIINFDIMESVTDSNQLIMFQTWRNQEAFDKHCQTEHVNSIMPQIQRYIELVDGKEFTIESMDDIDPDKPFRFNVLMRSDNREEYVKIVRPVIREVRQRDEGNMGYDLYRSLTNPHEALLVEIWENRLALVKHLNSDHFLEARKKTKGLVSKQQYLARMQEE